MKLLLIISLFKTMINTILKSILPIFFVIFAGYLAGKKKYVNPSHSKALITFVITFSLPALLFNTTAMTPAKEFSNFRVLSSITLGFLFSFLLGYYIFLKFRKLENKPSVILALSGSFPNAAFMGIPILTKLYGDSAMTSIVICSVISTVLLVSLTMVLINLGRENSNVFTHIKKLFLTPVVALPVLGLLFSIFNVKIPDAIHSSVALLGNGAPTIALFTMGITISTVKIGFSKDVFWAIMIKQIISPLVFFIFLVAFGVKGDIFKQVMIISTISSATLVSMMATNEGVVEMEANSSAILGTIVSVLTLSFFIYIL